MANNAIKYISNVGKSVMYSTVKQMKNMNPAISSFKETNADTLKSAYTAITHLKSTAKSTSIKALESDYGKIGIKLKDNLFEDIKTGNFYNRERIKKADDAYAKKAFGGDDFDFDFNIDDSSFVDLDAEPEMSMTDMLDIVGEKSSNAISTAVARSSEYIVSANSEMNKAMYEQNKAIFGNIHSALKTINDNVGMMVSYANGPMQTHVENSTEFYKVQTTLNQERNQMLKEMLDLQREFYKPQKQASRNSNGSTTMNDIIDANGMPNIEQYIKRVKQNMKNNSYGTFDMVKYMVEDGSLETMIASPLQGVTDMVAKKLIPSIIQKSTKSFNDSLSGVFSSAIAKINNIDSMNPFAEFIKNTLGIDDSVKSSINTDKYEKGPIPFDGMTKKAIIEVMPTYLAQIASALTGEAQTRFNYQTGKFVRVGDIKRNLKNMQKNASKSASYDLNSYFYEYQKQLKFDNSKDRDQFQKDLDAILYNSYKQGMLFNSKDKSRTASSYGLKGGKKSDVNLEIIRSFFDKLPNGAKMKWANEMFYEKDRQNKQMEDIELNGGDIITALFNDSISEKELSKSEKAAAAPGKSGRSVINVLNNIYKEVKHIREDLGKSSGTPGGSGTPKGPKRPKGPTSGGNIPFYQNTSKGAKSYSGLNLENAYSTMQDRFEYVEDKKLLDAKSKTLTDKILESQSIGEQTKMLFENMSELINKPAQLFGGLLKRADMAMYNMIFGSEDDKERRQLEFQEKGIGGVIVDRLTNTFDGFAKWLNTSVMTPITKFLNKELFKKAYDNVVSMFGFDPKEFFRNIRIKAFGKKNADGEWEEEGFIGNSARRFGGEFKAAGGAIKKTAKDFADIAEMSKKLNSFGKDKKAKNNQIESWLDQITKHQKDSGVGEIDNAATGMKRVTKTGVVAVSEGEMIIPETLNPFAVRRNLKKENEAKKKFKRVTGYDESIPGFAAGNIGDYINNALSGNDPDKIKRIKSALNKMRKGFNKDDYEDGRDKNILEKSFETLGGAVKTLAEKIKEYTPNKKQVEKDKQNMFSNAFGELRKYLPEVSAGAVMGGGVSLLTGMIGGPLLGAAVGGGISLIKHSESVQEMLFGELGEDNERAGGLLSKKLSNNITKYIPAIGKGAIAGGITSLLPIVPGGPVAGIILGSAAGFASKNQAIQDKLFGEEGMLKGFPEKVKKALPAMGAGAIGGLIAGPFGLTTNLILGSAIGFATTTNKFKDKLFGYTDEDGNYHDGIIKSATDHLFNPIKKFASETMDDLKGWSKKYIMQPLKNSVDPLKKQFSLMLQSIGDHTKGVLDKLFDEKFGVPFDKFLKDKVFSPLSNVIKKFVGGALSPLKFIASAPFKAVEGVADHYRTKQIQSGNADYMTASQRMAFRNKKGTGLGGLIGRGRWNTGSAKRYTDYDRAIMEMQDNPEALSSLLGNLQDIQTTDDSFEYSSNKAYKDFNKNVRHNKDLSADEIKFLGKQLKKVTKGSKDPSKASERINKYIAKLDLSDETRESVSNSANQYLSAMANRNDTSVERDQVKSNLFKEIKSKYGIDIDTEDVPKLLKLLNKEMPKKSDAKQAQTAEEIMKDTHKDTIGHMTEIERLIHTLIAVSNPNQKSAEEYFEKYQNDFKVKDKKSSLNKEFKAKLKEIEETEKEEREKRKLEKRLSKDRRNSGLYRKLFGNNSINYHNGDDYTASGAEKDIDIAGGVKVNTVNPSSSNNGGKFATISKQAVYAFVDGRPLRFVRDNVGKLIRDTSDSDTVNYQKEIDAENKEKKSLFSKLSLMSTSLVSKAKGLFGKGDDEEDEDGGKKKGILSKLKDLLSGGGGGKIASTAGLVFGLPILVDFWDKKVWPALKPVLEPLGDNIKDGISSIWDKAQLWLSGDVPGKNGSPGGLPGLFENLLKHWSQGLETIMTVVIPKAAEIIVKCLPTMLWNTGTGIVKGLSTSLDGIINAGRPSTDPEAAMKDYKPIGADGVKSKGFEIAKNNSSLITKDMNFSAWKTDFSTVNASSSGGSGSSSSDSLNRVKSYTKDGKTLVSGHSFGNSSKKNTITKGSNKYTTNGTMKYTLPDGTKGTIDDLINSDQVIGYVTDDDGNVIEVTGKDLWQYPELANSLGIDIGQLSSTEKAQTSKSMGLQVNHTPAGEMAKATGKGLIRGSTLPGRAISGIGKGFSKFGKLGTLIGAPFKLFGKASQKLGETGAKVMPSWATGTGKKVYNETMSKTAEKAAQSTAEKATKEAAEGVVRNAAGETITKSGIVITGRAGEEAAQKATKGAGKKVAEALAKENKEGLLKRFMNWAKNGVKKIFSINSVKEKLAEATAGRATKKAAKRAVKEANSEVAEKLIKEISETLIEKNLPRAFSKASGKVLGKISASVLSAGLFNVAAAGIGFLSGWRNAPTIVGVSEDSDLITAPVRVACGIASALNEFCLFGLIPLPTVFDILYPLFAKIFKIDTEVLDNERESTATAISEINAKYGTDMDVEDYNKARKNNKSKFQKNNIYTNIFGKGASIDEDGNYIKGKDGVVQNIGHFLGGNKKTGEKNIFGKTKDFFAGNEETGQKNWWERSKGTLSNQIDKAKEYLKKSKELDAFKKQATDAAWSYATYKTNTPASEAITVADDDPMAEQKRTILSDAESRYMSIRSVVGVGKNIASTTKKIITDGINMQARVKADTAKVVAYGDKKNLDKYWELPNTENGIWGGLEKAMDMINRVINFPIVLIKQLFSKFMDSGLVKGIKKAGNGIKKIFGKIAEFLGVGDSGKKEGSGSGLLQLAGRASGMSTTPSQIQQEIKNGTFISQLDPKYSSKTFNISGDSEKQTIEDTGCGPAAATMVLNSFKSPAQDQYNIMDTAKEALNYKKKDDGVTADYFGDTFKKHGLNTKYIMDSNPQKKASNIATSLYNQNKVVLMGQDSSNTSKANSPFGPNPHYVVATKMSPDGKYIYINDPESNRPDIAYPAASILNKTSMGITASAASGSRLNRRMRRAAMGSSIAKNKLRKYIGRGSYGPDTPQYRTWTRLRGAGLNEAQTAGVMGNIEAESGFNPNVIEGGSGIGFGLCQWSFGRRTAIESYAASIGKSAGDIDVQLDFLIAELNPSGGANGYANYQLTQGGPYEGRTWSGDEFQTNDIETATKVFCYTWERPNAAYAHMDRRLEAANRYYQEFMGIAPDSSSSGDGESNTISTLLDTYNVFDKLASAYGLTSTNSDSTSSSSSVTGGNAKQQALVDKMKSVEGQLAYSQSARNPDYGSGDCSSVVQWAYQNVLGVDPGSYTGAQEVDDDTYTVANDINDTSKLQPGDLVMYRTGNASTHVEMYAGNNQLIGHGGGNDGTTPGPTTKPLNTDFSPQHVSMVRRWTGFKDGGSGSGLTAGRGSKYLSKSEMKKVKNTRWVENNLGTIKPKNLEYIDRKFDKQASNFSARGMAPGSQNSIIKSSSKQSDIANVLQTMASTPVNKVTDSNQALAAIIQLLSSIVTNTGSLQSMVSILSDILSVMSQQSQLTKSDSDKQKAQVLETQKNVLLNSLKQIGNTANNNANSATNEQINQLIAVAESLAHK